MNAMISLRIISYYIFPKNQDRKSRLYYIIKLYIAQRLEGKQLPTGTQCYDDQNYVSNEGQFVTVKQEEEGE
jgi:hypothetical protein